MANMVRAAFPDVKERLRAEIERNADLLAKLPESSKAHQILQDSIDEDLERLTTELSEARRDPPSLVIGVVFIAAAIGSVVWAVLLDDWWQAPLWVLATVLGLLGIAGIAQGAPQTLRDEKGNPVGKPQSAIGDKPQSAIGDKPQRAIGDKPQSAIDN